MGDRTSSAKPVRKKPASATQPRRQEVDAGAPALPGEDCRAAPHESWSEAEKWAWHEICAGRAADFNKRYEFAEPLDPNKPDGWNDEAKDRRLSPAFLEAVLLHEPWRNAVPHQGVRVEGAFVPDPLDLSHGRIEHPLCLDECRFGSEAEIDFRNFRVDGVLSLSGSTFEGPLNMASIDVASHLFMHEESTFKSRVNLNSASIGGQLAMAGSTFEDRLNMHHLKVADSLFMRDRATFKGDVELASARIGMNLDLVNSTFRSNLFMRGASVGGRVTMDGATLEGPVNLDSAVVASHLFMRDKATFKGELNLRCAKVGGRLEMRGSTFEGNVIADSFFTAGGLFMGQDSTFKRNVSLVGTKVGSVLDMTGCRFEGPLIIGGLEVADSVFMRDAVFSCPVKFGSGQVGLGLDLSGATLGELDLTGTCITGELRLGSAIHDVPRWTCDGFINLRNAFAGAIQDRVDDNKAKGQRDAWPAKIQLDGFTYGRLGGYEGSGDNADMLARDSGWYVTNWLERGVAYSPQPYEQLAKVFRAAGNAAKAHDILYAGRERARRNATGAARWGLSALKWTVGYGLGVRYFRALWWVVGLTILGAVVHWSGSGRADDPDVFRLVWLSFDQLLPIAELDKDHAKLIKEGVLGRWALAYFYVHKLVGWLLASFLVAGLSGLTQK